MTGDLNIFQSLSRIDGGTVTFGDDKKGNIIGKGDISFNSGSTVISDVLLVDNLRHNLFSVSQFCDKGYKVIFEKDSCKIMLDNTIILTGERFRNVYVIYTLDLIDIKCLVVDDDLSIWLWHRRLGHSSMDNLSRISKKNLVKGVPKLKFENNKLCDVCQKGKQLRS